MLRILLIVLSILCWPILAGAETIYLKNGQVIKSKITKNPGYSIQIMQGNFPKTFFMEDVDRIEPDSVENAGDAVTSEKEALTEEKRDLIVRLLQANGARDNMNGIFAKIIGQLPPELQNKYQEFFKVDEIIGRLVPIYAKYYTSEELKELVNFYKSPVGQKHLKTTPVLMNDTMQETVKYFQEKVSPPTQSPNPFLDKALQQPTAP